MAAKKTAKKTTARTVTEHKLFKSHTNHSQHMCDMVSKRKMDRVAQLSQNAKYICHICGRAASKKANLCEPVEI